MREHSKRSRACPCASPLSACAFAPACRLCFIPCGPLTPLLPPPTGGAPAPVPRIVGRARAARHRRRPCTLLRVAALASTRRAGRRSEGPSRSTRLLHRYSILQLRRQRRYWSCVPINGCAACLNKGEKLPVLPGAVAPPEGAGAAHDGRADGPMTMTDAAAAACQLSTEYSTHKACHCRCGGCSPHAGGVGGALCTLHSAVAAAEE